MPKRLYAVPAAKGWIEIRSSAKPPKVKETEVVIPSTKREYVYGFYNNAGTYTPSRYVSKPCKMKLRTTVYEGGRVMATMKARRFSDLTKLQVKMGGWLELTPELITMLEKELQ